MPVLRSSARLKAKSEAIAIQSDSPGLKKISRTSKTGSNKSTAGKRSIDPATPAQDREWLPRSEDKNRCSSVVVSLRFSEGVSESIDASPVEGTWLHVDKPTIASSSGINDRSKGKERMTFESDTEVVSFSSSSGESVEYEFGDRKRKNEEGETSKRAVQVDSFSDDDSAFSDYCIEHDRKRKKRNAETKNAGKRADSFKDVSTGKGGGRKRRKMEVAGSADGHHAEDLDVNRNINAESSKRESVRAMYLNVARSRAAHFAYFDPEGGQEVAAPVLNNRQRRQRRQAPQPPDEEAAQQDHWPGPFSTARHLVQNRAAAAAAREAAGISDNKDKAPLVSWTPSEQKFPKFFVKSLTVPSLHSLCLEVLCRNISCVSSLEGVPDSTRKIICRKLCDVRKLNFKAAKSIFDESSTDISITDCSEMEEAEMREILGQVSAGNLEILNLGFCGRGLSDKCVISAFDNKLSKLHTLRVHGAYRLTDRGLSALVQGSKITALDLSQCSMITEAGIKDVAETLAHSLESLSLERCTDLNAMQLLPFLAKMSRLKCLNLDEVGGVTDEVVSELAVQIGCGLEELNLSNCTSLGDSAVAALGACCKNLRVLHLDNIPKLTDLAAASIADGCRCLITLSLRSCKFSDEAIAALITASGSSLRQLFISRGKAGDNTLLALAQHCSLTLEYLNACFCRGMTNEGLGFLADSCAQLHKLELIGCTQVTSKFLDGHSNPLLKVVQ